MASIRKIVGKTGTAYKITVSQGRDGSGKQIRRYMTWTPEPGMTQRQAEKAATKAALEFEGAIMRGLKPDDKQSFEQYAAYFQQIKQAEGLRTSTLSHNNEMLRRVLPVLGHIPLKMITPQMLNSLWMNLQEQGFNLRSLRASMTDAYKEAAKQYKPAQIAEAAGIGVTTVRKALRDQKVERETAGKLAAALGMKPEKAYSLHGDDETLAPVTVRGYAKLLSSIFSLAVKEGLIETNPVSRSTLPKIPPREAPHMEPEDIEAMLTALESEPFQWQVLIHFLLATGCRRGEACGLHWSKIDFDKGTVMIDRSLVPTASNEIIEGPTKTGRARKIMLPAETLLLLKRHRARQREKRFAAGDAWTGIEDYVFTRENGEAMSPSVVSAWIQRFAKRHGLPPLHTHELRHTAASLLLEQGVDVAEVSRRLGHAKTATTLNVYAHALERADKNAADTLGGIMYRRHAAK